MQGIPIQNRRGAQRFISIETTSRVLKTPYSGRLFKNAQMQGAQKTEE